MPSPQTELPIRHAVALGAIQGAAELLPVSSSAHLAVIPALLGWPYARLGPELRKAFEAALHAGTAAAFAVVLRGEIAQAVRELGRPQALGAALALGPPAVAGLLLERPIERRLGAPRHVAAVQILAGIALAAADRRPADRGHGGAGPVDDLVLGLAQAAALVPGVSRSGAILTAARLRRVDRAGASRLSRGAALPVLLAAGGLKGVRLARRGMPAGLWWPFTAGFGAAVLSTVAAKRLFQRFEQRSSYAPLAAYRLAFGLLALYASRREPGRRVVSPVNHARTYRRPLRAKA